MKLPRKPEEPVRSESRRPYETLSPVLSHCLDWRLFSPSPFGIPYRRWCQNYGHHHPSVSVICTGNFKHSRSLTVSYSMSSLYGIFYLLMYVVLHIMTVLSESRTDWDEFCAVATRNLYNEYITMCSRNLESRVVYITGSLPSLTRNLLTTRPGQVSGRIRRFS